MPSESYATAARAFAAAVEHEPENAAAWHGLALAFAGEGHRLAAIGAATRAIRERPAFFDAYMTLGSLCAQVGFADRALEAFEEAARVSPASVAAMQCLADAYRRVRRNTEAVSAARRAVELDPREAESYRALGDALLAGEAFAQADEAFLRALALDPRMAYAECGRGLVQLRNANWRSAQAAFERALAIDAAFPEARYNLALLQVRFGNYRDGFAMYPAIMDTVEHAPRYFYRAEGVPLWDGTPFGERRLVVAYEHGLGDELMMARFFPRLARFGQNVTIEAPPALAALLGRNFPEFRVHRFTHPQPPGEMDLHLPLMQLPAVLNVTAHADVTPPVPYLTADATRVDALRPRLHLDPGARHVGIVWHGNTLNPRDRWRAAPLTHWEPLAAVPGVRFHSLQYGASAAELAAAPFPLAPAHELIADMEDTAALLTLMDLVISVDTSVAHLAGALGCPTWMPNSLVSDYRWGISGGDTPWYPQLRIFRQDARDAWGPVFARIAAELRAD